MSEETEEAGEQWDFYFQPVDGEPASIMLDFAFDGYAPMDGFPKLTMVFVDMATPGDHGLGDAAEATGFEAVHAALDEALKAAGAYHVGRVRHGGKWHLSFYSAADTDLVGPAEACLDAAARDHAAVEQDDPDWNYYSGFLLPSDERRQWMSDRHAVAALIDNGDDLSKPRAVTHTVYFQTEAARTAFLDDASGQGFTATAADDLDEGDWKHPATAEREDSVELEAVHRVVVQMRKIAAAHSGWYDGWGCEVQSS